MSLQVENSQYTNTHYKKNESDKVIKTNIITQAQNFIRSTQSKMMLNVVKRAARVFLSRLSLLASVLMAWMNWQLHSSDNLDRLRVRGMDHLIFLNQERYFGIKNQGMISERYCYYYYYYFGKKRHHVKTEHIVNKLKENRLKKDKLKEIQG